jgi:TRAP transporter 4TM/12TM fusion protein
MTENQADAGHESIARWPERAAQLIALGLTGFVVWTTIVGPFPNIQQRAIVLCLVFAMGFMLYPAPALRGLGQWTRLLDLALFAMTAAACTYVFVNYFDLMMFPGPPEPLAVWLGIGLCLAIFEVSRRTIGWSFGVLMLVFTAYALWGHLIPGRLGHAPAPASLVIDALYLGTDGIWGSLMSVYASLLVLFVVFSALMMATGVGENFMNIGKLVAGGYTGGPAKIAVVASAFIGSVTGSSVTNVAMTGSFTIPMMKRLGYRPQVAGAIEATASSGGQITPPMMGAGLFLMAELLGMDVGKIMLVAAVPAFLFYVSVLASVHFESRRERIAPIPSDELPTVWDVFSPRAFLPTIAPFVFLIGTLMVGYSAQRAILSALVALIVAYILCAASTSDLARRSKTVLSAVAGSARPLVVMGALIAAAAMVVTTISFFGVGPKLSELVLSLGAGNLLATLLLAGLVVVVIGMGVPTTAAYVLGASVISPTLQALGVAELPAHMFIFYFATLSALTPPVCAAVFVAAGIAEAPWLSVALQTMRFAVIKYFLPFIFIFHPQLLMIGSTQDLLVALAFTSLGAVGLSAATSSFLFNRLTPIEALVLGVSSLLVLWPDPATSMLGLVPMTAIAVRNWRGGAAITPRNQE